MKFLELDYQLLFTFFLSDFGRFVVWSGSHAVYLQMDFIIFRPRWNTRHQKLPARRRQWGKGTNLEPS